MFGWRSHRQREHEQFLQTLQAMQKVLEAQALGLNRILAGFEVHDAPQVRIMDDSVEWQYEQGRLAAQQAGQADAARELAAAPKFYMNMD